MYGQAKKPWEEDWSQPGVQVTPPDARRPYQLQQEQGQAAAAPYAAPKAAADLTRTNIDIKNAPLNAESTRTNTQQTKQQMGLARTKAEQDFSQQFLGQPEVKMFQTVAQQYGAAIRAARTGTKSSDYDLINAYAKLLDPNSVVREGEVKLSGEAGSQADAINAWVNRIKGTGLLDQDQRKQIMMQVRNRAGSSADQYRQSREYWGGVAGQYGFDPGRVLGPNYAQPYQQLEADYFGHPIKNGNSFVQPGAIPHPGAPGGRPGPLHTNGEGDIGFNQEAAPSLPAEHVRAYDAFLNANPGASPEQLRSFVKGMGFGEITNADQIIKAHKAGAGFRSGNDAVITPYTKDMRGTKQADEKLAMMQQIQSGMPMGGIIQGAGQLFGPQKVDAAIRGVADVPLMGMSEELGAGLQTLASGNPSGQAFDQNFANQNGVRDYDKENNFKTRLGGQILGGFGLPTGIPGAARGAGASALRGGLGRVEALAAAGRAGAAQAGREGALYGGGYGIGSTDGNLLNRAEGGVVGAGTGALGGYALGRTAGLFGARSRAAGAAERNAAAGGAQGERQAQIEAAQAAQALGIDMPRYVAGGRTAQRLGTLADQTPLGAPAIGAAQDRMIAQSQAAKDGIAARVGTALQPEAMGERAGAAGNGFVRRSGRQARNLYSQAERQSEGVPVPPQAVMQTLAGMIREESQVPGGTRALPVLQRYAQAFENGGPISIQGARKLRTELRASLVTDGDLTPSNADRLVNQVMDGVSTDITNALTSAGRQGAVRAYRQADDFWRQRSDVINDVIKPYIGRDGENWGADVAKRIGGDAKGNSARLASFLNNIEPQEANEIRATLIDRLGRATKGQQNAEGDGFSLDTFLTNYDEVRQSAPHIFGAETNRDLGQLARVAERAKAAGRAKNHSNTGSVIAGVATFTPVVSGAMSGAATGSGTTAAVGFLGTAAQALAQYGGAHLLASPGFARRLAQTAANPRAARGIWSDRAVAQMARSSPALASDISGFRATMLQAMNDNVGHMAAASDDEEKKRRRGY